MSVLIDSSITIYEALQNIKDGKYVMPITPRILMAQGKCTEDADKYFITHITDAAVKKYNEIIRANANEFVIHPDMVFVSESK